MQDHPNWVEALNISPENLKLWSEQVPPGRPLLVWCLEQGHIPLYEYFAWASEAYGLPIVNSEFFTSAFDPASLNAIRSEWSPWCFPVETWEDVTVVACVEPPRDRQDKFAFVLAEPAALLEAWGQDPTRVSYPKPETEGGALPPPLDGPVGVSDLSATAVFRLNLDNLDLAPPEPKTPTAPTPIKVAPTPPSPPPPTRSVSAAIPIPKPPEPSKPTPRVPAPPPPAPTVATAANLEAPNHNAESPGLDKAFESLKEHYAGSLIIKCVENGAVIYKWDPILEVATESLGAIIPLNSPSLFRIVSKTRLPYHGFAVESQVHREFFSRLGMKDLPSCVTAVPLINETHLWGMLVAFGNESAQTPSALAAAQKTADQMIEKFGETWFKAA